MGHVVSEQYRRGSLQEGKEGKEGIEINPSLVSSEINLGNNTFP